MTEKTPEEEQAIHSELCEKISQVLDGYEFHEVFDALAAVQARICAELDYPEGAACDQVENFLHCLRHEVENIPAESIITIPETN